MAARLPFKHNVEKKFFEKWTPEREIANFVHPYRLMITALPNAGKTSTALSIIAQAKPHFDEIILIHAKYFDGALDPGPSNEDIEIKSEDIKIPEYADVDFTCALKTIPLGFTYFRRFQNEKGSKKNLLIIDDCELLEWGNGKRDRKQALNKLFSYQSTHYGLSIIICCQDATTQLGVGIRRECNIFIFFKGRDRNAIQYAAAQLGFPKNTLMKIFDILKTNHDSICFDFSDGSPYPIRLNVVNPVKLVKDSED
jgi:hypothetical protein